MTTTAAPARFDIRQQLLIVIVALVALLITQIVHEWTHAIFMWLVGSGVDTIQLFAVRPNEVPVVDRNAQIIISGSAAIVNVIIGFAAVLLFHSSFARQRVLARLLLMYLAAYMLLTGFGYFLIDALFYAPDAPFFPDWQYVIHALGGGWDVRAPLLVIGVVGSLGVFFWLPKAALRFVSQPTDKSIRIREMLSLTLIPYVFVNVVMTIASFSHPLGTQGVVLSIFQYWFGYVAIFWAFFIGGMWTDVQRDFDDAAALSAPVVPVWLIGLAVMWATIAFVMLPGLSF